MVSTPTSGRPRPERLARCVAFDFSVAIIVVQACLFGLAATDVAFAQPEAEKTVAASTLNTGTTATLKLVTEDDALRIAALEKSINDLRQKGRLTAAIVPARQVLQIRLKALGDDHPDLENSYQDLATILEAAGRYGEAEPLHRKALKIRLKRVSQDNLAKISCYLDEVSFQQQRGNFGAAKSLTLSALNASGRIERFDDLATAEVMTRLALLLAHAGQESQAEDLLRRALAVYHGVLKPDDMQIADETYHLAKVLHLQGKNNEAEQLCRTAQKIAGRNAGATPIQCDAYRSLLISCLKAQGKSAEVGVDVEAGAKRANVSPVPVPSAALSRGTGLVAGNEFEAPINAKSGTAAGHVLSLDRIQATLRADAALVAWVDPATLGDVPSSKVEHWACVVRQRGQPDWIRILGTGPGGEWTADDDRNPYRLCERLAQRPDDHAGQWRELAAALGRQWLAPLECHLAAKGSDLPAATHLIVLPPKALAGVPIETLVGTRRDGQLQYTVSYVPSALIFVHLREKRRKSANPKRPPVSPRLLALGDPVFTGPDVVGAVSPGSSPNPRDVSEPIAQSRGDTPRPLPGTRREVLAIADLFDHPETLLGSEASEQRLDELAKTSRLREFSYVHMATHGKLAGQNAQRSALLLARDRLSDPLSQIFAGQSVYDGELSAEQVLRTWSLNAELVTVSACWSGVGRLGIYGADLGFSHALILKGAKRVVLSLWNVDDAATALLMTRFYQNLLGRREELDRPLPMAEALAEAKNWLRTRTAAEVDRLCKNLPTAERIDRVSGPRRSTAKAARPYDHPYFWAAFILIGDPD